MFLKKMALFSLAVVPLLLTTVVSAVSHEGSKITYHPKPSAWMMKPLTEKDSHHSRIVSDSGSWVVTQSFYEIQGSFCTYQPTMQLSYTSDFCIQTGPSTYAMYSCTYGMSTAC